MELIGLDSRFQPVKTLRCTNIQWNRRYYEAGDYQIQLRAEDWDTTIAYVYTASRPETGMVEKVETEHQVKGDFVLVSGFFLEGMLNWKVTYPKHSSTGNVCAACKGLAASLMSDTGVIVRAAPDIGADAAFDSEGEFLGDATYTALKKQELGQRIRFDYATDTMIYEVWQGLDRTQSQNANNYAVFCQSFGTVDAMTLTTDSSNLRNYIIARYVVEETTPTLDIDLRSGGGPKRILFADTGLSQEDGQTWDDFMAAVQAEARKQAADHVNLVNIDADVLQNNLLYLADYDLGDKCDVRDDRLALAYETRIIEINEVWKKNTHTVTLQFGDKIPTVYQRGKA